MINQADWEQAAFNWQQVAERERLRSAALETEVVRLRAELARRETMSLAALGLSVRALNALHGARIETLEQLVAIPPCAFLSMKNVGRTTAVEIERALPRAKDMLGMKSAPASADREGE